MTLEPATVSIRRDGSPVGMGLSHGGPAATPSGAAATVEAVLAALPELSSARLGERTWVIELSGDVRHRIPVTIELGRGACVLRSFLLRGPRPGPGAGALHHAALRKNAGLVWLRLSLDADDDLVMAARIPMAALTQDALQEALGEILTVGESAFEALVHLAYPGVFPPLAPAPGHRR